MKTITHNFKLIDTSQNIFLNLVLEKLSFFSNPQFNNIQFKDIREGFTLDVLILVHLQTQIMFNYQSTRSSSTNKVVL